MSEELKNRTKKFAPDVTPLCAGFPQVLETRHAIGQIIRSSNSVAANSRSACRKKSKVDFISKPGTFEKEADESGFWLEMLRAIDELQTSKSELRTSASGSKPDIPPSKLDDRTLHELTRMLDEANQLVAITVPSRKTARGSE